MATRPYVCGRKNMLLIIVALVLLTAILIVSGMRTRLTAPANGRMSDNWLDRYHGSRVK